MPEIEAQAPDRGHLTLKATTAVQTDEGTFEAVISTASVDRDGDIVEPQAMATALQKWADIGKLVPLAWNHSDEVIGTIDPATARVDGAEVAVKGWIDQSIPRGEEAWRLVKSGTLSFSYGMLIPESGATKRAGGGMHITELDLFEVSVVPVAPANNDTRVLGWKSVETLTQELQQVRDELEQARGQIAELEKKEADRTARGAVDSLKEASRQAVAGIRLDGIPERKSPRQEEPTPTAPSEDELRQRFRDLTIELIRET